MSRRPVSESGVPCKTRKAVAALNYILRDHRSSQAALENARKAFKRTRGGSTDMKE